MYVHTCLTVVKDIVELMMVDCWFRSLLQTSVYPWAAQMEKETLIQVPFHTYIHTYIHTNTLLALRNIHILIININTYYLSLSLHVICTQFSCLMCECMYVYMCHDLKYMYVCMYVWIFLSGGSNVDFLRAISYYLKREDKLLLTRMLSEQSSITVRFKNLSFRCRLFSITAAHTYTPSCAIVTSTATTTNATSGSSSGGATSGATATSTTTNTATAATTTTTHILLDNSTPSAIDCVVDIGSWSQYWVYQYLDNRKKIYI